MTGVVVVFLVGLFFWSTRVGMSLDWLSYDVLYAFAPKTPVQNIFIIQIDSASCRELHQDFVKGWDRALHTRLLRKLTEDGCPFVIFDLTFVDERTNTVDQAVDEELAAAMKAHGHVVLAAEPGELLQPELAGSTVVAPTRPFRERAIPWGVAGNYRDEDGGVRRIYPGNESESEPSLAWMAAVVMKA